MSEVDLKMLQALFARLQQLATVAGDVLPGKEKLQKVLLARLTETIVMWLCDEQEFWGVFEDESIQLKSIGLQQVLILYYPGIYFWQNLVSYFHGLSGGQGNFSLPINLTTQPY